MVEQGEHEAGAATEAAENRALPDPCGSGDGVHGHRIDATFGDQQSGGVEQESTIAGRIASLGCGGAHQR